MGHLLNKRLELFGGNRHLIVVVAIKTPQQSNSYHTAEEPEKKIG